MRTGMYSGQSIPQTTPRFGKQTPSCQEPTPCEDAMPPFLKELNQDSVQFHKSTPAKASHAPEIQGVLSIQKGNEPMSFDVSLVEKPPLVTGRYHCDLCLTNRNNPSEQFRYRHGGSDFDPNGQAVSFEYRDPHGKTHPQGPFHPLPVGSSRDYQTALTFIDRLSPIIRAIKTSSAAKAEMTASGVDFPQKAF